MSRPRINVMILPEGETDRPVRSYSFPWYAPRAAIAIGVAAVVLLVITSTLFLYYYSQSRDVASLRRQVQEMTATVEKVDELQEELNYHRDLTRRVAGLLGISSPDFAESVAVHQLSPLTPPASADTVLTGSTGSEQAEDFLGNPGLLVTNCPPDPNNRPRGLPLRGRISRGYAPRQANPSLRHTGLDLATREGTPVLTTADGVVEFAGQDDVYGFLVIVDHGNGFKTTYGHNSVILVKSGESVRRGDRIAFSGNTGVSTAPHLHYEITQDGVPVDPTGFLGR